jgi:hypothetical protein
MANKMLRKSYCIFTIFFLLAMVSKAQQLHLTFQNDAQLIYEKYLYSLENPFHTSIKPYRASDVYQYVFPDTITQFKKIPASHRFLKRAANIGFHEHFLEFDETGYVRKSRLDSINNTITIRNNYTDTAYVDRKFHITAAPFIRFELGYDNLPGRTINFNKRGVVLTANIGKKVSIFTSFSENQAKYPEYLTGQIRATRVVPGEGKARNFETNAYDFSNVWAYFNYRPIKNFSVEVGNGKHFIGDGYRSLLLSDNAFVYPYAKATAEFWRFKYQIIYAEFQNDIRETNDFTLGVTRKFSTMNYLTLNATNWMQIGLYEGIIWERTNAQGNAAFDWNFLNPIIGIRGLQKKLDVNTVYGLTYKFTLPHYMAIYGQWMIDKFPTDGLNHVNNRMGMQIGFKYFDIGGIENLNLQLEFNRVRPYAYSASDSVLHYTHYEQPLAHPLGANFNEGYGKLSYRYKRFYTSVAMAVSNGGIDLLKVNADTTFNFENASGSEVLLSNAFANEDVEIKIADAPIVYGLIHADLRMGVIVNPKLNLKFEAGLIARRGTIKGSLNGLNQSSTDNNLIFLFSMSTQLFNNYYDNIQRLIVN